MIPDIYLSKRTSRKRRSTALPTFFVCIAVLTVGWLASQGVDRQRARSSSRIHSTPVHLLIGIKATDSVQKRKGVYCDLAAAVASRLVPKRDARTLYRVDRAADEFSSHPASGEKEQILQTIQHTIGPATPTSRADTSFFWQEVARRSRGIRHNVVILFVGDGRDGQPNKAARKRIIEAARKLVSNPKVRAVVICGAQPHTWAGFRATFSGMKERLHLFGPTELNANAVTDIVNQARH